MATPTPIQSVTVSLRSGVSEATLPNNIKMKSGFNYVISLEDYGKLSRGARETVIATPTFNTSPFIVPGYTATNAGTDRTAVSYLLDLTTINNKSSLANINADAQAPKTFFLGEIVYGFNDNAFKLVLVDSASATVELGTAVVWGGNASSLAAQNAFKAATTVTSDISDVTDDGAAPEFAGVAIGTITAGQFGWIQVAGVATAKVAATVDAGSALKVVTTDETLGNFENEIQTLSLSAGNENDTFKLTQSASESSAVTIPSGGFANVTAAQIKAALLTCTPFVGKTADIAVVKATNDYVITFSGTLGSQDVGAITVTSKVGAADGSVAETNKGAGSATTGNVVGTAQTAVDTGTALVELRSSLARDLISRKSRLFLDPRN